MIFQNLQSEAAVLCIFTNNEQLEQIPFVNSDWFTDIRHINIINSLKSLYSEDVLFDTPLISSELTSKSCLNSSGGIIYLEQLKLTESNMETFNFHIAKIKEEFVKNKITKVSDDLKKSLEGDLSVSEIISNNISELNEASGITTVTDSYLTGSDFFLELSEEIKEESLKVEGGEKLNKYINSHYKALDEITGGFGNANLILLAARPGMGKSALAINMALRNAVAQKKNVGFFSLEMTNREVMERILSSICRVDYRSVTHRLLNDEQRAKISAASKKMENTNLFLDDNANVNIHEFCDLVRSMHKKRNLDIVYVDYLQLISGGNRYKGNPVAEVSEVSMKMKLLAKELDIPIVALSQLSRGVESRPNKRPINSDLRGSGSLEQDADKILFMYRDSYYEEKSHEKISIVSQGGGRECVPVEVSVAKNRQGATGTCELAFDMPRMSFYNL